MSYACYATCFNVAVAWLVSARLGFHRLAPILAQAPSRAVQLWLALYGFGWLRLEPRLVYK